MEKDFEGVESYSKGIIQDINRTGELETLAILSFVDVYSGLGLPHEMISNMVALNVKGSYITNYPYAAEAFINTLDKSYNISLINGRNVILSSEHFKQFVLKMHNCSIEEKLGYYAAKLIDCVSKCCINGISTYYKDLLEKILITKYNGDLSATEESFYATDFSNLILSVPTPESKEMAFQKLVDIFKPLVNNLDDQEDELAYHMLAHFWGHFGRLYRSKELGSFTNYDKSVECCKKAEDTMLAINRNDPYIYTICTVILYLVNALTGW